MLYLGGQSASPLQLKYVILTRLIYDEIRSKSQRASGQAVLQDLGQRDPQKSCRTITETPGADYVTLEQERKSKVRKNFLTHLTFSYKDPATCDCFVLATMCLRTQSESAPPAARAPAFAQVTVSRRGHAADQARVYMYIRKASTRIYKQNKMHNAFT